MFYILYIIFQHKSFPGNRITKNISELMNNKSPLSKLCAKRALSN